MLTTRTYHNTYQHDRFWVQGPLRGSCSNWPGVSGLPYYRTPPMTVPDVIRGLAVWRHNTKQKQKRWALVLKGIRCGRSRNAISWLRMCLYGAYNWFWISPFFQNCVEPAPLTICRKIWVEPVQSKFYLLKIRLSRVNPSFVWMSQICLQNFDTLSRQNFDKLSRQNFGLSQLNKWGWKD